MFNPSRDQARDFFFEAWRKYRANEPLTALETIAVELIAAHPEYHTVLENRDKYVDRDYSPEAGATNPFLHLSMHLSIREQISINQPAGVRAQHVRLSQKCGSPLDAEHAMMDCLGEMIWQAQRNGTGPDPAIYFSCLEKK
ncbi:MAG: DUF1841 family protein [Pseudomonadota bacterium]